MLYQTHIVLNMSMPVSKDFLNREFHRNHPLLDKFLEDSINHGDLPKEKHPLDRMWSDGKTINIVLTWHNRESASSFKQLWESIHTYNLISIDVITLDEDLV